MGNRLAHACTLTHFTSSSSSGNTVAWKGRNETPAKLRASLKRKNNSAGFSFTLVMSLGGQTSPCVCRLACAGSVALQAVQDALSQQFDVPVGLRVRVNELQLVQAPLLQQHAAITRSCSNTKTKRWAAGGFSQSTNWHKVKSFNSQWVKNTNFKNQQLLVGF